MEKGLGIKSKSISINNSKNEVKQLHDSLSHIMVTSLSSYAVNNNSVISLDEINSASDDIVLNDDGSITFNTEGVYYLYWWMNFAEDNNIVSLVDKQTQAVVAISASQNIEVPIDGNMIIAIKAGQALEFINDSGNARTLYTINTGVSATFIAFKVGQEGSC
ncbi:hypothetical protein PV797_08730 [Clostridiaceae bacterium M8S5]|nr:hypothetical protein PV797_08730 [Clostridiaceae bacterium M8S5]